MDPIDRHIIACLRADARQSFTAIGGEVGLSAPAVKRRVDRLETAGIIRGYTAIIEPAIEATRVEAFIELFCRDHTVPDQIRAIVEKFDEVVAAYTVTGDADALLHVRTADMTELEATLEGVRAEPNVDRSRSTIVLSRLAGA